MLEWIFGLISVLLVSGISLVGVLTLWVADAKLKKAFMYMVSFAAGGLFGDVFFHLIPETAEETGFGITASARNSRGCSFFLYGRAFFAVAALSCSDISRAPSFFCVHEPLWRRRSQPD